MSRSPLKSFAIFLAGIVGFIILAMLLLHGGLTLLSHHDDVFALAQSVDGIASYFIGFRLALVVLIIIYWHELVIFADKFFKFNHRQRFILRALYPYIVASLVLIELFSLIF